MLMLDWTRKRSENCGVLRSREAEESKSCQTKLSTFSPDFFLGFFPSVFTEDVTFLVSRGCSEGIQIGIFNKPPSCFKATTKNITQ